MTFSVGATYVIGTGKVTPSLINACTYTPGQAKPGKPVCLLQRLREDCVRFPTGLLSRACALYPDAEVVWTTPPPAACVFPVAVSLRPYQQTAVVRLLETSPRRGGVLQAATGAGKTNIAAKVIQLSRCPAVFITHTQELLVQAQARLEELLGTPIGRIGAGRARLCPDVNVAMIQTLHRADPGSAMDAYLRSVPLVIFDEVHHVAAPTVYRTLLRAESANTVVGLSASPWRDDGHDLLIEAACGPVVARISASELIDAGYLVAPEIQVFRYPVSAVNKRLSFTGRAYHRSYDTLITRNAQRNEFLAKCVRTHPDRRVLVTVARIEHGVELVKRIPGAEFLNGMGTRAQRLDCLNRFRAGALQCLITTLGDEGWDVPCADMLVLASAGRSSTRALQRIGRVLRPFPGKTKALVVEVVDDHPALRSQFYARRRIYATEPRFEISRPQCLT